MSINRYYKKYPKDLKKKPEIIELWESLMESLEDLWKAKDKSYKKIAKMALARIEVLPALWMQEKILFFIALSDQFDPDFRRDLLQLVEKELNIKDIDLKLKCI